MELKHLRSFVALAEDLHYGRAAEHLGIAQPVLSTQIQALEAGVGAILFDRSRRRVALTEAGRLFLPEARATLTQAERARSVASRAARGALGHLEIGYVGSALFGNTMPRILRHFRRHWPDVRLSLREIPTTEQIAALRDQTIDIGFLRPGQPEELTGITTHLILKEPLRAVIPADHPLTDKQELEALDLAGQPFIHNPRRIGTGLYDTIVNLCRQVGFIPSVIMEANQLSTIVGLVAAGVGVSIVPDAMRNIRMEGAAFLPLTDPGAYTLLAAAHRDDDTRLTIRHFLDELPKALSE